MVVLTARYKFKSVVRNRKLRAILDPWSARKQRYTLE
jgi:hypothetical protein